MALRGHDTVEKATGRAVHALGEATQEIDQAAIGVAEAEPMAERR